MSRWKVSTHDWEEGKLWVYQTKINGLEYAWTGFHKPTDKELLKAIGKKEPQDRNLKGKGNVKGRTN